MGKKGFTLIELLAVIVILAVISLISIPIVLNIIEKARKSAFIDSAYGLMESAKAEYIEAILDGSKLPTLFEYPFDHLKFSGSKPDGGKIVMDEKGNIGIAIYNDKWCINKEFTEKEVNITKYENETCVISNVPDIPKPPDPILIEEQMKKQSDEVAALDPDRNLRYVGGNPKNYIKFNNELWRIIGVFDGQAKIIRKEFYSTRIAWDTNKINDWSNASLQKELNEIFFNNINSVSKSYIDKNHIWNIGGGNVSTSNWTTESTSSWTRQNFYSWERGTMVYSGRSTKWTGAIGLIYPSDYGYATNETDCDTSMYDWHSKGDSNPSCYNTNNNWLANTSYNHWTLTPSNGDSYRIFNVYGAGIISLSNADYISIRAYPIVFLKDNTKIKSGDGTEENPYELFDF